MSQPCEGTWTGYPRIIETESPHQIYVSTCSGCDEIMVVFRGRWIPTTLTRQAKDHEIEAALREYFDATEDRSQA